MTNFLLLVGIATIAMAFIFGGALCFACEMAAWDAEDENG